MPKRRPQTSGYARIAQAEEEDILEDSDEELQTGHPSISNGATSYAPIQPRRQHGRMQASGPSSPSARRDHLRQRSNSGVDIKAINARLERWADEIAQKFKIRRVRGKSDEEEQLEIHYSVFQAPDGIRPATAEILRSDYTDDSQDRVTKLEFDHGVESVRTAIEMGVHPKLISQGSSGSYFARNTQGKVVGVFKPKDEEPYASKNPKWSKWIHRNLFPFFFGRACLIPNLSYVSEAAAYVLDTQLRTNIVPYTDIVSLSSKSFHYDYWDRRAYYRKKKPFPEKVGSFQYFLKGYKDATLFLKEHPWPDERDSGLRTDGSSSQRRKRRWADNCRTGETRSDDEDDDDLSSSARPSSATNQGVFWTEPLQQSFREQLEKLVILDYIMRNTDRGLDNWMIKVDTSMQTASIVAEPPKDEQGSRHDPFDQDGQDATQEPYKRREQMTVSSTAGTPSGSTAARQVTVSLGAIDNSLSWPWKHPDAWRSYPFGWLFLPVSLIGQPFSEATRKHFLPLLTSKQWWSDTQLALRKCFSQDVDFKERMYARQIAIVKGQAWNVVETLKTADHGPLELTRRARVYVWDDLVDVPVAVPLRASSREARRRAAYDEYGSEDDLDDAAAKHGASAASKAQDLLGFTSPSVENADRNPFNISRHNSSQDVPRSTNDSTRAISPSAAQALSGVGVPARPKRMNTVPDRPPSTKPRMSYDGSRGLAPPARHQSRRYSLSHKRGIGSPFISGDDDNEGDLGYAATEDREANQKRVIVERLETVKSKNPVFTWC